MRGVAASVAAVTLLFCGTALAGVQGNPTVEPLGKGYWCERDGGQARMCGGLSETDSDRPLVITVSVGRPIRHFKVCSTAPSGNSRCVPIATGERVGGAFRLHKFGLLGAFPHRLEGVYKLAWYMRGEQVGGTVRFRLG